MEENDANCRNFVWSQGNCWLQANPSRPRPCGENELFSNSISPKAPIHAPMIRSASAMTAAIAKRPDKDIDFR